MTIPRAIVVASLLTVMFAACSGEPSAQDLAQRACKDYDGPDGESDGSEPPASYEQLLRETEEEALPAFRSLADQTASAAARDESYRSLSFAASDLVASTDRLRTSLAVLVDVEYPTTEQQQEYDVIVSELTDALDEVVAECRIVNAK